MRMILLAGVFAAMGAPAMADFNISFSWGNIPLCTTGRPNVVPNPEFTVQGVPAGTNVVTFELKDLDVPNYRHGGASVQMAGDGTVPSGVFTYKSPCPPSGSHTYEWRATARASANGAVLGRAAARRNYPE